MSKFAVRGGHQHTGQDGCAVGYISEIDVDRRYYQLVIEKLQALGHEVLDVTPPEANRTLADSLNYGINMANDFKAEYFISCHVDAFKTDVANGCEVICGSQDGLNIGRKIVTEFNNLGFATHGGAYLDVRGLAEIRAFNGITLICEPFFCDSSIDIAIYNKVGDEGIASAIVKGITGQVVNTINPTSVINVVQHAPQPVDKVAEAKKFIGTRCTELQTKLDKIGYKLTIDGDFGNLSYNAVIDFQGKNGLIQDGLAGNATFSKLDSIIANLNVVKPTPIITPQPIQDIRVRQLQHNLNRLFNSGLKEDNDQGLLTSKAMTFATSIFGVSGLDNLLSATNQVLSFPLLQVGSQGYAVRFLQYVLHIKVDGDFGDMTKAAVVKYQISKRLEKDGKVGQQTWGEIFK